MQGTCCHGMAFCYAVNTLPEAALSELWRPALHFPCPVPGRAMLRHAKCTNPQAAALIMIHNHANIYVNPELSAVGAVPCCCSTLINLSSAWACCLQGAVQGALSECHLGWQNLLCECSPLLAHPHRRLYQDKLAMLLQGLPPISRIGCLGLGISIKAICHVCPESSFPGS
jgi:hypothetical protein